jgi:hypothetical protein
MNCIRLLLGSLSVVAFVSGSACDSQTKEHSSSSTHWVTCETDDDCAAHPSHPTCEAGYCVNTAGERLPASLASGGRGSVPEVTGGNAAVRGGGSPGSTIGGAAASGNGGSAAASGSGGSAAGSGSGSGSSVAAGSGGDAGSAAEGGASSSGQAGAGGVDCGCLKGGQAPVCGIDGRNYDAICGDECVPVEIACRGQCPCPDGSGGSAGSGTEPGSACSGPEPHVRPDLDRTCESSSDCFAGRHLIDCCGTMRWIAYNVAARADFELAESGCTAMCPCPMSPTLSEDGLDLGNAEAVPECIDGTCIARHPDAVGECLDAGECIDTDSQSCIVADGPVGNGVCRGGGGLCFLCECASPDTPIATPKGYVAISELRAGDLVYSVDRAAIRAVPIAMTHRNPVKDHEVVEVRLESGATLAVSASHPIAGGRTFGDLSVGAPLGDSRIASVRRIPYAYSFTHDILPDSDTGTYFAAGVRLGSTLRIGPALTAADR